MLFGTPSLLSFQFFVIVFYTCNYIILKPIIDVLGNTNLNHTAVTIKLYIVLVMFPVESTRMRLRTSIFNMTTVSSLSQCHILLFCSRDVSYISLLYSDCL